LCQEVLEEVEVGEEHRTKSQAPQEEEAAVVEVGKPSWITRLDILLESVMMASRCPGNQSGHRGNAG
jgi:hypothetical protein